MARQAGCLEQSQKSKPASKLNDGRIPIFRVRKLI
jgi:hypothetical protein